MALQYNFDGANNYAFVALNAYVGDTESVPWAERPASLRQGMFDSYHSEAVYVDVTSSGLVVSVEFTDVARDMMLWLHLITAKHVDIIASLVEYP